jgi:hypothetical protein
MVLSDAMFAMSGRVRTAKVQTGILDAVHVSGFVLELELGWSRKWFFLLTRNS